MSVIDRIADYTEDLTAIRRDFHAHPEIGFQEHRNSARVAELLEGWQVICGIGGTGAAGVLDGRAPGPHHRAAPGAMVNFHCPQPMDTEGVSQPKSQGCAC